jgi:hypothetical protein
MANECIPLFEDGDEITAVTTSAVTGKTCVAHSAALGSGTTNLNIPSVATATAALGIAGVAAYDAASGARVTVIRGSRLILPITAGGAITVLNEVEVGSGGKVVTKASGVVIGRALTTGVNNQDCMVELY